MNLHVKHAFATLALLGAAAAPGAALAGHLSVGVGVNLGPPGYYYAPAPVYTAPPPVYYYDPPPEAYGPPVVYGPPYYPYYYRYRQRHCWWEDGYRVCR